jgi:NAD(P)-dependent dehydrogenase (short-subunit alcohol dehydrogenase family)
MAEVAQALDDHVALVTGAASGIGRAGALALSRAGASVAILDTNAAGANTTVSEIERSGGTAYPVIADLSDLAGLPAHVEAVAEQLGPIDILINCAAFSEPTTSLFDVDMDLWQRALTVDLTAPFELIRLVGRSMIQRGRGGRIVNVSSSSAFRARFSKFAYGAAKAGLVQLTRSVAAELGPLGINVNAVAPGLTRTPAIVRMGDPEELIRSGPLANLLERLSEPEDVAEVILFLCLPASRQITAQTIHVSAGAIV